YTARFLQDMDSLNVMPADVYPRATDEIPTILEMTRGLMDKGHAYESGGSVYFRVRSVPDYGKLSHRTVESMVADLTATRSEDKEHPMDFALWKAAKPGEPYWESPWGPGRPGWHIECSAMSLKHLGETLDIHGGGQDLMFPHHENEIAQSESYTGRKPFVRFWLHNGLLQSGKEKMSKSLGNLVTIRDTLRKSSADGLRILVLSSHYRSPLSYSDEALLAAEKNAERLRQATEGNDSGDTAVSSIDVASFRDRFIEAMDDDFNAPRALVVLYELAREMNRHKVAGADTREAGDTLRELSSVLGLTLESPRAELPDDGGIAWASASVYAELNRSVPDAETKDAGAAIEDLIDLRSQLRREKQWHQADVVRNRLDEAGIVLEDSPQGTTWKRKPGIPVMVRQ
ncbi:MAG: cysteine--tRNA ligase, partial [Dehalococcoidia bacterium]